MSDPTMLVLRHLVRQRVAIECLRVVLDRTVHLQGGRSFGVSLVIRHTVRLCLMHLTR